MTSRMLEKIRQAIKNPARVMYGKKENLTKRVNLESLVDESLRYFPSNGSGKRIFFVAHKHDYGNVRRGLSFEENNFLHSLIHSGYDVVAFDPLFTMKKYSKKLMNRILIESVFRCRPDIVYFVLFTDEIEFDTLRTIKDTFGIKTINWFCDDHWRFDNFSKYYAPYLSYIVTTDKEALVKYENIGYNNAILSQWACNNFLYRKLNLPYKYDVSFIGQPHGDRARVIKKLRKAGIKVDTYGYGWRNGRVTTYEMIEIFNQSRINLNLSNASRGKTNQIKGRDFEIPGCGGFMITGHSEELSEYFTLGEDIVVYNDVNELIEKIKYYLYNKDEREKNKESGYIKTITKHTYTLRFANIFDKIFNRSDSD